MRATAAWVLERTLQSLAPADSFLDSALPRFDERDQGLLRELVPSAAVIAVLLNPSNPPAATQLEDVQEAARALGQQIHILHASSEAELEAQFDLAHHTKHVDTIFARVFGGASASRAIP